MEPIYAAIRKRACQIASRLPSPVFYKDLSSENKWSRQLLESDPLITDLRRDVAERLKNYLGHGLDHADKVALDAGAIVIAETKQTGHSKAAIRRQVALAQSAALLHDIQRHQPDHAKRGAEKAKEILKEYPLPRKETDLICLAIRNHEAFKPTHPIKDVEGMLISNSLYDADKFRWGPDNFIDTIWHMVSFEQVPVSRFVKRYPKGLEGLARIKDTFRTDTGKNYGPQFIDLGLKIGQALYETIKTEFSQLIGENGTEASDAESSQ